MQPQENPCRVLLGLHGNSTERFFLKNLYCLECSSVLTQSVAHILCYMIIIFMIAMLRLVRTNDLSRYITNISQQTQNVAATLVHRLRCWTKVKPTLIQRHASAEKVAVAYSLFF